MAKKISWMEAAEIAGVTDRTMRRIRDRYGKFGYTGLFDQRRGKRKHSQDSDGNGGGDPAVVSGSVLRSQHAALSRKVARRACDPGELYVGAAGPAGGAETAQRGEDVNPVAVQTACV